MAAATVDSNFVYIHGGMIEQHTTLSAMTNDQTENVAFATGMGAPAKTTPLSVAFEQTVDPTSHDTMTYTHLVASDSITGNTIAVVGSVETGGNLSGAKVKVIIRWLDTARQDAQSINADNDS